jgi:membrane associated rhomboid family serine protease
MAFFHQPESRQPVLRVPAIVLALIALLVAITAWEELISGMAKAEFIIRYGFVPARYSADYLVQHALNGGNLFERAVPFVSYMFLHADWSHVAVNSVWLLPFGSLATRRYGNVLFLLLFLICGVAGAVIHLALNWGSASPVIGASAAISGLMGVGFRTLQPAPGESLAPILSGRILLWSASWIGLNVVAGLTGFGAGPGVHMVAWQAHIGGYFAGLLLAGPFDGLRRRSRPSVEMT